MTCTDLQTSLSTKARTYDIIAAVNDDAVLESNLLASPAVADGTRHVIAERGHDSAGKAYNAGLARTQADVVIFAHQDVYLPRGWDQKLNDAIDRLETEGQPWALIGVWGIAKSGAYCGRVWCSASNRQFAGPVDVVREVESVDEIIIVMKRSSGLRFDENLPGYHLYATDIAMEASQRGLKTFVIDAPVIHNSRPAPGLYEPFAVSYRVMQKKWAKQLPIRTSVVPITRFAWTLTKCRIKAAINIMLGRVTHRPRHEAPARLARELGYES